MNVNPPNARPNASLTDFPNAPERFPNAPLTPLSLP